MPPNEVTKQNETSVWWKMYWPKSRLVQKKKSDMKKEPLKRKPFTFTIDDNVRISHLRNVFSREYDQKWSGEVFKISDRFMRGGLPIYRLKEFNGDEIKGTFYPSELQKVSVADDKLWKVEKVLKQRKRGGKIEYFVRWLHWPKSYDSWVKKEDMKHV